MTVWIVGQAVRGAIPSAIGAWVFQGVFDDEHKACAACKGELWFVAPAELNVELPIEAVEWPGLYYPLF